MVGPTTTIRPLPTVQDRDGVDVLWQKDTGSLYASACVLTYLQLAEAHGAEVREDTPVIEINWQDTYPEVLQKGNAFERKSDCDRGELDRTDSQ